MAASLLKIGESRVWINPEELERVESAITKDEIRRLIHEDVIIARDETGVSRGRHRTKTRKKGRRGPGSKKGSSAGARKRIWITKIRTLRSRLKELKAKRVITREVYRRLLPMTKGNAFRSVSHLNEYLERQNFVRRR